MSMPGPLPSLPELAARHRRLADELAALGTLLETLAAVPPDAGLPRLLRAGEVAAVLGFSEQHVYDLFDRGILPTYELPSTAPGATRRNRRMAEDELRAWIAAQRAPARTT